MMATKSVQSIYRRFKPRLVICDFDGTITNKETITPLIELAKRNWTSEEHDKFAQHLEWYNTNHSIYEQELLKKLQNHKIDETFGWDAEEFIEYFGDLDDLDQESLTKFNAHQKHLANINLNELGQEFKKFVRPNVKDVLKECIDDGCVVKILSLNWSSFAIHHALDEIIDKSDIVCNELEYDEQCVTTGRIITHCADSLDKLTKMYDWGSEREYDDEEMMYIGDAHGDFLASCCAEISVWFETDKNEKFLQVLNDQDLMNKNEIFTVNSWI